MPAGGCRERRNAQSPGYYYYYYYYYCCCCLLLTVVLVRRSVVTSRKRSWEEAIVSRAGAREWRRERGGTSGGVWRRPSLRIVTARERLCCLLKSSMRASTACRVQQEHTHTLGLNTEHARRTESESCFEILVKVV